jgi:V8-like Glu-specific endopeptidase
MLAGWKDTIASPGAEFVRVHFVDFDLGPGEELVVSNPDGSQSWAYSGRGVNGDGDFWSFAVDGDSVKLEVRNATGKGSYRIVEIGHGTVSLKAPSFTPEVVCGTDGRENIACRTGDAIINNAQKPVARLLFTSGRSQYLCTGELIAGSNANTMITNNHCFSTQKEVNTVQAKFNYQYTTCAGGTLAATTDYAGGALLKTNAERYNRKQPSGLDYTLFTLQGNPESTWGELAATTKAPVIGQLINFIQHPGGNPKKIGYWEDAAHTVRCKIDTVNMKYGNAAPGSQAGYGCDSEGGSSGSAITDAATGRVVALHHYGGVASVPCLNSGTLMSKICADAGSLLSCVSN